MNEASFASRASALLNARVVAARPLAGGDLSAVFSVELDDGRRAIVKGGPSPATEAAMLGAIAATGSPAPRVLAHDDAIIVLEQLPARGRLDDAWPDLGTVLSGVHAGRCADRTAARYGWPEDYAFGDVRIENAGTDTWPEFWAERRLANQTAYLPPAVASRVAALAADLGNRLPAAPPPALLHGDLWGGNILVDGAGISGLIDPACYYGDAEVDLAMLELFNQPDRAFFSTYGNPDPGRAERRPIYQLWPALVHLRLFGQAYRPMVERMLSAAGV